MKNIIFLICLSIISVALLTNCRDEGSKEISLLKEKVGKETLDAITTAQVIEIEDIEPSKERGYAFTGFGKALPDSKVKDLKKLILNDKSYEFNRMKSCLFIPKVAYHFKAEHQAPVTLLYSPWCKQIKVISKDHEAILEADAINDQLERLSNSVRDRT